jgi:NAD+ synthase (glutamine-hydrolysing)
MLLRTAVVTPAVHLADPIRNAIAAIELARTASSAGASLIVFPELCLTGYAIDDLHHQGRLLDVTVHALGRISEATADLGALIVVGAPLDVDGRLFNCAIALHRGAVIAAVPKTYLPNYREFYEARYFATGRGAVGGSVRLLGCDVPFGTDVLIEVDDAPGLVIHLEVCEDLWTAVPPSSTGALAGATVLVNLSASNATLGKADDRRMLARSQSLRCVAGHVLSAAGPGESTTDLAWDGQGLVHELGRTIAEGERFATEPQVLLADLDIERIVQERLRLTTFNDARAHHAVSARRVRIGLGAPLVPPFPLRRPNPRFPYVPDDPAVRDERCFEAYAIQCQGLAQRLRTSGTARVVLGVSGGLDSTHALLVAVQAMRDLGRPATDVLAYGLPGFATSERTRDNARRIASGLGVTWEEIDITRQSARMLSDIGHPAAAGDGPFDVTFENVQAGARTSTLFRLANLHGALVIGTGDLSELALGWCTYGVGDQMSHYNVNASVPKTLLRHLVRWVAERAPYGPEVSRALEDVVATPISPELVPADDGEGIQDTEQAIGPYELHDFFLHHTLRFGLRPESVRCLAVDAWGPGSEGRHVAGGLLGERTAYSEAEIDRWLAVFLARFFGSSQFKRTASPSGPKVTSGGSLSPRGDWRAPADGNARIWTDEWPPARP